jgi:putative endonuclease
MTVNHGVPGSSPGGGAKPGIKSPAFLFHFKMPSVYIIYSAKTDSFYTGFTTENVSLRIDWHNSGYYGGKFTAFGIPWVLFLEISCITTEQARKIEEHIKKMKSKIYIKNLKKYPEMIHKPLEKYKDC